jgi:hypothetical protein
VGHRTHPFDRDREDHAVERGERFIALDRYEVHADEGVADEAKRVLSTMPGRS